MDHHHRHHRPRVLFRVYIFDYIGHIQVILFNLHTKGEAEQRNIKEREKTLLNNMITGLVENKFRFQKVFEKERLNYIANGSNSVYPFNKIRFTFYKDSSLDLKVPL